SSSPPSLKITSVITPGICGVDVFRATDWSPALTLETIAHTQFKRTSRRRRIVLDEGGVITHLLVRQIVGLGEQQEFAARRHGYVVIEKSIQPHIGLCRQLFH